MIPTRPAIGRTLLAGALLVGANQAAAQPSPLLLVLARGESSLLFVDPVAGKVLSRLPTGKAPHEVITSEDGKLAFVSVPDDSNILVIDVPAQKELRRISIGPKSELHGMVYVGGKLYFTAQGYKLMGRYDLASNQIDWLCGTGQNRTHMLVITKDRNTIFTSNVESDTISVIENTAKGPPGWKITEIPVGKSPEGMDMSPDGKELWTATWGDGGISIIDVATRKVIETLHTQTTRPIRLAFTPDGKRVLVTDARGDLLVLDALTRKEIKRMKVGTRSPSSVTILPDGSRALLAVEDVAVLDLKTLEVTRHIPTGSAVATAWVENK
jgi:YVTN family beta-propeller protein